MLCEPCKNNKYDAIGAGFKETEPLLLPHATETQTETNIITHRRLCSYVKQERPTRKVEMQRKIRFEACFRVCTNVIKITRIFDSQ